MRGWHLLVNGDHQYNIEKKGKGKPRIIGIYRRC